jgi:hypothetical protein
MVAAFLNSFGCWYRMVHHCECLFLHLKPEPFHDWIFITVLASLAISQSSFFLLVFKGWLIVWGCLLQWSGAWMQTRSRTAGLPLQLEPYKPGSGVSGAALSFRTRVFVGAHWLRQASPSRDHMRLYVRTWQKKSRRLLHSCTPSLECTSKSLIVFVPAPAKDRSLAGWWRWHLRPNVYRPATHPFQARWIGWWREQSSWCMVQRRA